MRSYEVRTSTVAETTDEQIRALAASFYPTIKAFYNTDEGRKMFEDYMNEVNGGEDKKPAA